MNQVKSFICRTPLQQITAVSAIINGGTLYKPYIVKSINEPETNSIVVKNTPDVVRKVISEDTSKKVRYALESVVANGTGHNAYISGYRVGGKTGTAQKVSAGKYLEGNYITSFIGFLPADKPEIVVYIAVDNAKGITQYGGTVAAPIAKKVLASAIDALNIKKRKDGMSKEYNYLDTNYYLVTNVIGMTRQEAVKALQNFKVEFTGSGEVVTYQSAKAGEEIAEGETIRLMLKEQR